MEAPITYIPKFVTDPDNVLKALQRLEWEQRDAPRQEYYANDYPHPYVYGVGKGQREYKPRPYSPEILSIRASIENLTKTVFEVCFLNRYLTQKDQLGWHADDSPEMDDSRPIAIVSLGVEREIWFRPLLCLRCSCCGEEKPDPSYHKMSCIVSKLCREEKDSWAVTHRTGSGLVSMKPIYGEIVKLKLGHGSLCLMAPGMQDAWQHRIPKASNPCGERISLTYRGYVVTQI